MEGRNLLGFSRLVKPSNPSHPTHRSTPEAIDVRLAFGACWSKLFGHRLTGGSGGCLPGEGLTLHPFSKNPRGLYKLSCKVDFQDSFCFGDS